MYQPEGACFPQEHLNTKLIKVLYCTSDQLVFLTFDIEVTIYNLELSYFTNYVNEK